MVAQRSARCPDVVCDTVGVGLVDAAAGTAQACMAYAPELVVLIGTAGWLVAPKRQPERLPRVVVPDAAILGDAASTMGLGYAPPPMASDATCSPAIVHRLKSFAEAPAKRISVAQTMVGEPPVTACCPLAITKDVALADKLSRSADVEGLLVENLELFSVLRAIARMPRASRPKVGAVLGVSNHVDPNGHEDWKRFGAAAVDMAAQVTADFLFGR